MTTTPTARFEHLLSSRALIGWGAPLATARPAASPLYEFGGGYPDPASFPYDGMVTRVVRERLEGLKRQGRRCKLIYTIVNFQNPAGPDLSLRRRQELVQLAEEHDTFILEDDAYGELRFEGEPKPPVYALDRSGRVIRAGTLSKILGAGVRLGWLCAPRAMLPAFQGFNFSGGVNPFMSRVASG